MIIYCAVNVVTGVAYIGQTQKTISYRIGRHYDAAKRGRDTHFAKALRKYSRQDFEWSILENCQDAMTLNSREIYWIALYKKAGIALYNMTDGGDTNHSVSQEIKEKISKAKLGHKHSEETKAKISLSKTGCVGVHKGKTFPDTWRANIARAKTGVPSGGKGLKRSEESRMRMSIAQTGVKRLGSTGAKNHSAIAVICLDDGACFDTITDASKHYGIVKTNISRCCKGERKTAGKRVFSFINKEI